MKLRDRLGARTLLALGLKIFGAASGLIATVIMTRVMSVEDFGLVAFLTSLVSFAVIGGLIGHESLIIRELPRLRHAGCWGELRGLLTHAGVVCLALSCLISVAAMAAVRLGLVPAVHANAYLAACISLPMLVLCRIMGATLQGFGRVISGDFLGQSVVQVGVLVAVCGSILLGFHLSAGVAMGLRLLAALTAAQAGCILVLLLLSRQPAGASLHKTAYWLREASPYALLTAALFLVSESDTLIVKLIAGDAAAGLYRPPQRIVWAISFGLMAVNTLMQPRIAGLAASKAAGALQEAVSSSVRLSLLLTLPAVVVVVGFADPILALFGEPYRAGATTMRILAIGQLVNTGMGPVAMLLNMTGQQRTTLRLTVLVVAPNIVLCGILTSLFGINGAAVATAISMVLWNVLLWRAVRHRLGVHPSVLAQGVWSARRLASQA